MPLRVFLAGATGVIGRRLVPQLLRAGYAITGTTRSPAKADALHASGVTPVVVDVFDKAELCAVVAGAVPDVIVHQLTDLSGGFEEGVLERTLRRNAMMRTEGSANLVDAALRAGVTRVVAQSIAFAYVDGPLPHGEGDPLQVDAAGTAGISARGVLSLERALTETKGVDGVVLRYGRLYGPGAGPDSLPRPPKVHVDAAARAALLAIQRGAPGIYNVADPGGEVSSSKAVRELAWSSDFRISER